MLKYNTYNTRYLAVSEFDLHRKQGCYSFTWSRNTKLFLEGLSKFENVTFLCIWLTRIDLDGWNTIFKLIFRVGSTMQQLKELQLALRPRSGLTPELSEEIKSKNGFGSAPIAKLKKLLLVFQHHHNPGVFQLDILTVLAGFLTRLTQHLEFLCITSLNCLREIKYVDRVIPTAELQTNFGSKIETEAIAFGGVQQSFHMPALRCLALWNDFGKINWDLFNSETLLSIEELHLHTDLNPEIAEGCRFPDVRSSFPQNFEFIFP